jgi:hypothetical protein
MPSKYMVILRDESTIDDHMIIQHDDIFCNYDDKLIIDKQYLKIAPKDYVNLGALFVTSPTQPRKI